MSKAQNIRIQKKRPRQTSSRPRTCFARAALTLKHPTSSQSPTHGRNLRAPPWAQLFIGSHVQPSPTVGCRPASCSCTNALILNSQRWASRHTLLSAAASLNLLSGPPGTRFSKFGMSRTHTTCNIMTHIFLFQFDILPTVYTSKFAQTFI